MNVNSVAVSGTVTKLGKVNTDGDNKTLILYIETGGKATKVIEAGEVVSAHLNPVRVKFTFSKDRPNPVIHVGSYVVTEGKLYSYKLQYPGVTVYSTGVLARTLGMGVPLSREDRGKVIMEYKREVGEIDVYGTSSN